LKTPDHVLSVKVLTDSKRNQRLLSPNLDEVRGNIVDLFHRAEGSGENDELVIPESYKFKVDFQLDDIKERRRLLKEDSISESVIKAVKNKNRKVYPENELSKPSKKSMREEIDPSNITKSKRQRKGVNKSDKNQKPNADNTTAWIKVKMKLPALKKTTE
jgi:hypothetical protein